MENKVYELLDKLKIEYSKVEHPPVFTVKDSEKYNIKLNSLICKNLFITNSKKSKYYVVVLPLEKRINLKSLQIVLNATRLSFGDEKLLEEKLGIKKGSVSIFNIINIKITDVIFLLDKDILQYEKVGFHPNINTETIIFNPKYIAKILENYNAKYMFF